MENGIFGGKILCSLITNYDAQQSKLHQIIFAITLSNLIRF